jgi:hypothetical protein
MSARPAAAAALDLGALEAISGAVASGLGLPEVVRAAARALDASLVVMDRSSSVLAVAARSSADERALMSDAPGVGTTDLRVGDEIVGRMRLRGRSADPAPALLGLVATLIASEVERLRAPDRASEAAQSAFLRAVLDRQVTDRDNLVARAGELGVDLGDGGAIVVVRAHHFAASEDDWRGRVLAVAERAARVGGGPGASSIAAVLDTPTETASQIVVLVPEGADAAVRRVAEGIGRELHASLHGFTFAIGHSRVAADPVDLYRAGNEALLAANVAEAGDTPGAVLAFEDTGAYRLLLPAMSEDPASCSGSTRRPSPRSSPTTSSTRPTSCRRSRPTSTRTATSRAPPSGCSPTATRSATAWSACASCRGSTSARRTAARSSGSASRPCGCSASPRRAGPRPRPAHGAAASPATPRTGRPRGAGCPGQTGGGTGSPAAAAGVTSR